VEQVASALTMMSWYENFRDFARAFWDLADPTPLVWSWHMTTICQESQAISEEADRRRAIYDAIVRECGDDHALRDQRITDEVDSTPLRLVLLIPPRGSKSTLLSKLFVLWRWARRPDTFLAFSAMESKIPEFGLAIRDVLRSDRYQAFMAFLGQAKVGAKMVQGRKDSDATIALTLSNGARWSGHPIGGRFTGKNVDISIIDDPHDVDEAMGALRSTESKAAAVAKVEGIYKSKINDRYNLRMVGITILIMQRVHLHDLAAFMTEQGARVVTIPAEYDPTVPLISDPFGITQTASKDPRTIPGQSYNASRFPPAELKRLREIDPFGYATKFLMRPTLQEGSKIQRSWFKNEYNEDPHAIAAECSEVAISVDSASTTNKRSDYTSMGVWGRKGSVRILLDRRFGKWGLYGLIEEFKSLVSAWPEAQFKFVENKSSGIQLLETAERLGIPGVVPVNPTQSKRDRLGYAIAALEAGNVWIPASAPWKQQYVDNMVGIDAGGAHDDDGDMTSQVMERWNAGFSSWLTSDIRALISDARPAHAITPYVRRWERKDDVIRRINRSERRQTTDAAVEFYAGIVPGWCTGRAGSASIGVILDMRGTQVAMVEVNDGGIAEFVSVFAEEALYWGVERVRYAELPGMPASQMARGLSQQGVGMSAHRALPGQRQRYVGEARSGYTGVREQAAALWASFIGQANRGLTQVRDMETLTRLETIIEDDGIPKMPDGGPVTGRTLAYLLAVSSVADARPVAPPQAADNARLEGVAASLNAR